MQKHVCPGNLHDIPDSKCGGAGGEGQAAIVWSASESGETYWRGGPCPGGGLDGERHRLIITETCSRYSPGDRCVKSKNCTWRDDCSEPVKQYDRTLKSCIGACSGSGGECPVPRT